MNRNPFHTVVHYPNVLSFDAANPALVDEFMATVASAGVTHVQVNHLPDRMHPEQCHQPDNFYLSFANFGPSLDLYVSSKLNRGVYPELYLERNRNCLLSFAAAARRHGIKPLLYLCEPKFVPERFFQKHPLLRGARVDNPGFSHEPLFAMSTDRPEVLAHYRDMMEQIMTLIPDLAMISLFTSDSAAGFDYNPDLYVGPNGPRYNRKIPLDQRVVRFLNVLLEEGRRISPELTVHLTSGFSPEDRQRVLDLAPEGIIGSVYGLYAWAGGLEEMWGYQQANGQPWALDREAAFQDRVSDMRERYEIAARKGAEPLVHAMVPTYDYPRPLRFTPHPYETIRIVQTIAGFGASAMTVWGRISSDRLVPWDANQAAMLAAMRAPEAAAAALVTQIAESWVGTDHAVLLCQAWKACDEAITQRPNWRPVFSAEPDALPGPLVPDLSQLTPEDKHYYRTVLCDDLETMRGGVGWFVPYEPNEQVRDYVLDVLFNTQTLPQLTSAMDTLDTAIAKAAEPARAVLINQREHIETAYLWMRSSRNWYEAGRYLAPGDKPSAGRCMATIVDDELELTRRLIELLDGGLDRLLTTFDVDAVIGWPGPSFVDRLRQRVMLMERHRNDLPAIAPIFQTM